MKNYTDTILKCRCSYRMKRGVHVQAYGATMKNCPNCRRLRRLRVGN